MAVKGRQIYLSGEEIELIHNMVIDKLMAVSDELDYYEEFEPKVPGLLERLRKKLWYYV